MESNVISDSKKRIIEAIERKPGLKAPLMYRALPTVNQKLLRFFSLDPDIKKSWRELLDILNADCFSSGASLTKFTKILPAYVGKHTICRDSNMLFAWGIYSKLNPMNELETFLINRDFASRSTIEGLTQYDYPKLDDFDFDDMKVDLDVRNGHMVGTGCLSSIFMISAYLRGFEKLFVELISDKKLAHYYIERIGEFALDATAEILKNIGSQIDTFAFWDDLATQRGLMISHELFVEFYLPWYKRIVEETNKFGLKSLFHVCGNANEIIPDLIDIGVDILDPVQVSARNMDLVKLKKKYGGQICFHGGIDVQTMLPKMKPDEIITYVNNARELFSGCGGLILGPSHETTQDTPIKNILAVYRPDLV